MKFLKYLVLMVFVSLAVAHAQANKWEKVVEFSGYGTTQTRLIPMMGEKWRIKYTSNTRSGVIIDMLAPDGQILSHVIHYQSLQSPFTESWSITPGMEWVAFRIEGDINGWKIVIEQYIDEVASWELFKWRRDNEANTQKKLVRHAMWVGEASEETSQKVTIQAKRWRILAKSHQTGRLKYEVLNGDGVRIVSNYRLEAGTSESWIYTQGEFTVSCSSIGTPWDLIIDIDETADSH